MAKNFHESYAEEQLKPPPARSTGLVFAGVALVVAAFFYNNTTVIKVCLVVAALLVAVSFLRPSLLDPINILWFRFSIFLSKIVNPIVLAVMFVVVIVPMGFLMRLFRDPLLAKPDKGLNSYWVAQDAGSDSERSMENQF